MKFESKQFKQENFKALFYGEDSDTLSRLAENYFNLFDLDNINEDYLEKKAWGYKYTLANFPTFDVSINWVLKGGYCSLHHHQFKHNRFLCLIGLVKIEYDINKLIYIGPPPCKRRKAFIAPNVQHRFTAIEDSIFVEVEYSMCSSEDIIRESEGGILKG